MNDELALQFRGASSKSTVPFSIPTQRVCLRSMAIELECKIAVPSHLGLADRLLAAGAMRVGLVLETNRLFDNDQKTLLAAGCGLRVRDVQVLDGDDSLKTATLTFKGRVTAGPFKRREEIELPIGDAASMAQLLQALGYRPWIAFEKRRESWRLSSSISPSAGVRPPRAPSADECKIELDELPMLGCFVEVEGPTDAAIRGALAVLKLDPADSILRGYPALIAERLGEHQPIKLGFT